jgi:hypothetical protein
METEMVENCENCAFKVNVPMHQWTKYECHRYAPRSFEVITGASGGEVTRGPRPYWPEVKGSDFCGEWELEDVQS